MEISGSQHLVCGDPRNIIKHTFANHDYKPANNESRLQSLCRGFDDRNVGCNLLVATTLEGIFKSNKDSMSNGVQPYGKHYKRIKLVKLILTKRL